MLNPSSGNYQLPKLGSRDNPFASVAHAQKYGFTYFAREQESNLVLVRLAVMRGSLHFLIGFARANDEQGAL